MRAVVWNTRSALLYSIGGWTVLGGMLHYSYKTAGGGHENESDDKTNEELSRDVEVAHTPIMGLQVTTVTKYHKELPPLTRLLRRMTAYFTASSSPPPSEN